MEFVFTFLLRIAPTMIFSISFCLNFAERVVLRFERFDKRVAVATKRFPNDLMYSLIHDVIRDFEAFFLERLNHEPPIDQIFY